MIVNGQGRPKLIITDVTHPTTNPVSTVLLPYCEKQTLTFDLLYVSHNVQRGIKASGYGVILKKAVLDYSGYLDGQTLLDMIKAFQVADIGYDSAKTIVLVPRSDAPQIQYNVKWANSIDFGLIFQAGGDAVGHSDVVFEFEGLDLEPTIPIVTLFYGTNYGGTGSGYGYEL